MVVVRNAHIAVIAMSRMLRHLHTAFQAVSGVGLVLAASCDDAGVAGRHQEVGEALAHADDQGDPYEEVALGGGDDQLYGEIGDHTEYDEGRDEAAI